MNTWLKNVKKTIIEGYMINASVVKKPEENWIGRYSKGLRNPNGERLENLCQSNNVQTQVQFNYLWLQPELYVPVFLM